MLRRDDRAADAPPAKRRRLRAGFERHRDDSWPGGLEPEDHWENDVLPVEDMIVSPIRPQYVLGYAKY